LVDPAMIDLITNTSGIRPGERVLEIGTGKGALTRKLAELSPHLEAFELDEANFMATKGLGIRGLKLHPGDAFAASPDFDVLVSSLPYSESSNFVEWLSERDYARAVVVLQKDFVEKLVATPGEKRYRAVSVISQISSLTRIVREVGRDSFSPPPKVISVVAEMKPRTKLSQAQMQLIKLLFSQRRRKLSVALKKLNLGDGLVSPDLLAKRVQELTPREFKGLLELPHL
jgi:16S rRNA (adenine1518-N6/adenine1519-N6)-dimethyltransferase